MGTHRVATIVAHPAGRAQHTINTEKNFEFPRPYQNYKVLIKFCNYVGLHVHVLQN